MVKAKVAAPAIIPIAESESFPLPLFAGGAGGVLLLPAMVELSIAYDIAPASIDWHSVHLNSTEVSGSPEQF